MKFDNHLQRLQNNQWHDQELQEQQDDPNPNPNAPVGDPTKQAETDGAYKDPYTGVDLDLVDDATRKTIETARTEHKQLWDRAQESQKYQSEADRLRAEIERTTSNIRQQPTEPQPKAPTFRDKVTNAFVKRGVDAKVAAQNAEVYEEIFGEFAGRTEKFIDSRMAPIAGSLAVNNASDLFIEAQSQLPTYFEHEAVAVKSWEYVQAAVKDGMDITPAHIANYARIAYCELLETGELKTSIPNPRMQNTPPPRQSRLTFPGAGNYNRQPVQVKQGSAINEDTRAALEATRSLMTQNIPKSKTGVIHITRGNGS